MTVLVTNPNTTTFVLVFVIVGAVTVATAALETPSNTVTGGGVLVVGIVVMAAKVSFKPKS